MFKRLIARGLVFGMAALAPPAAAQTACADRQVVAEWLTQRFDERRSALGLRSERELVEIWASEATGTWTILITTADGTSCVVASGTSWLSNFPPIGSAADPTM